MRKKEEEACMKNFRYSIARQNIQGIYASVSDSLNRKGNVCEK